MRTRHRIPLLIVPLLALAGTLASPATAAPPAPPPGPTQAVAYQVGISHDGYSGDTGIVAPLNLHWTLDLTGSVSYPLIADGKVFVTVVSTPGGAYGTTLYALDQATGATVWSQTISGTYYWSNAAYDAGRVYVVNFDGLLRAFDAATGALVWSTQLPGQYAVSSPPTADSGVVYVGGTGTVYAVSETDGSLLWTGSVSNGDHSSPALSATDMFVSYACGLVYDFDRATGTQRWLNGGPCSGGGGKTPVYHSGQVYSRDFLGNEIIDASNGATVGTFQATAAPALAGKTGVYLDSGTLRAANGRRTLWTFTGDGGLVTAPIVVRSTVFVGSSSGMLYALDLSRGRVLWSVNVGAIIYGPDEQNVSQPLTGLGAGQGLLVVPAGNRLAAYGA
jgi:outer membrane protein assembly factor BamB